MESLPPQILENELSISTHDQLNLAKTCKTLHQKIKPVIASRIKSRLAHLFFPSQDTLIDYLSNNGIIAGGSIVYALNHFVSPESVSDIDVYINDKTRFLEVIKYVYDHYTGVQLTTINPIDYSGKSVIHDKISIVNLLLEQQRVNLQFIYHEFESATDIIKNYDYDYVQCGLDSNNLIISQDCSESHKQRRIIKGYHLSNATRLRKATLKGFSAPVFGFTKNIQTIPLTYDLTENDLASFQPMVPLGTYNIDEIRVIDYEIQSDPIQLPNNTHNLLDVYPIYWNISIGSQSIKSMYLSLEINVEQFIPASPYATESEVKITPLTIGQYTIKYCKIKNMDVLSPGKQTVIARLRCSMVKYGKTQLLLKIVDLVNSNGLNYDKIIPFQLPRALN